MKRTIIYFNEPINRKMSLLHFSKTLMYDFYYNNVKKQFENNSIDSFTIILILFYRKRKFLTFN